MKNEAIEESKTVEKTSIREHAIQVNTEDRAKNRPNESERVVQEPLGAASSSDDKLPKRPPQERLRMWVEQLQACDITISRLRAMESLQDAVKTSGGWPAWIVESIGEMPKTSVNEWRIGAWDSVFAERQTTWTTAQKKKAKWTWDDYMKEYGRC